MKVKIEVRLDDLVELRRELMNVRSRVNKDLEVERQIDYVTSLILQVRAELKDDKKT